MTALAWHLSLFAKKRGLKLVVSAGFNEMGSALASLTLERGVVHNFNLLPSLRLH